MIRETSLQISLPYVDTTLTQAHMYNWYFEERTDTKVESFTKWYLLSKRTNVFTESEESDEKSKP